MFVFSGKWIWVPMYVSIFYVIVRNFNWQMALWCVIAVALTIIFADQVCATVIRPLVCRLRPTNPENPLSELVQIVNDYRGGRYGFPSCHAANTFGLAFFIFYLFRNRALNWFIMLWAIVTCYSRSYLGVHYPGDLLVGAIVGFIGATLCYRLFCLLCKYKHQKDYNCLYVPTIVGGTTIMGILIYALVRTIL